MPEQDWIVLVPEFVGWEGNWVRSGLRWFGASCGEVSRSISNGRDLLCCLLDLR